MDFCKELASKLNLPQGDIWRIKKYRNNLGIFHIPNKYIKNLLVENPKNTSINEIFSNKNINTSNSEKIKQPENISFIKN